MFVLTVRVKQRAKYPIALIVDGSAVLPQNNRNDGITEFVINIDSQPHQLILKQLGNTKEKYSYKYLIDNLRLFGILYDFVFTQFQCRIVAKRNCMIALEIKLIATKSPAKLKINVSEIIVENFSHLMLTNQTREETLPFHLKWRYFLIELLSIFISNTPYMLLCSLVAFVSKFGLRSDIYLYFISIMALAGFGIKIVYHIFSLLSHTIKNELGN